MTTAPSSKTHQAQPNQHPASGAQSPPAPAPLNRELSWLAFNRRVLSQSMDEQTPLLERVRFLAIFSSNLDEFVMKRVGGLKGQVDAGVAARSPDGLSPTEQLAAIREVVTDLQSQQAQIWMEELLPALTDAGVVLAPYEQLTDQEREYIVRWRRTNVFPILTPLAVDPGHRFPFISNLSTSIGVLVKHPDKPEELFARVKTPTSLPRWIPVAENVASGQPLRLVNLTDVIRNNLQDLFPDMILRAITPFRVTRTAELDRDDDGDIDDLLLSMEEELRERRFARAVRLEVGPYPSQTILTLLLEELDLTEADVYQRKGPLDCADLFEIAALDRPELKHPRWSPVVPPRLVDEDSNLFATIRQGDLLVHHPYESFAASVERFISAAASDPKVLAIKQTLYRTSPNSPFVPELIRAAESGKQVACLVELRARFDESANITVAQRLEKAGVHVAYGVVGHKTHCKTSLVVRQESDGLRCYAHIGTGNYNSRTAKEYTDLGLLTCDAAITEDCVELFNYLTGRSRKKDYNRLLVAPVSMRRSFNQLIDREIEIAESGGDGRIVAKMNSLEDRRIMERLYKASQAGVKIDLIVRGFCCLRPGEPGISDNIRVVSIIGRFLEHSRIFHFGAGADNALDGEWFISSSDWMYRNLNHRVEAATPILNRGARGRLKSTLDVALADRVNAWRMNPDGSYTKLAPAPDADPNSPEALGAFEWLMRDRLSALDDHDDSEDD